MGLQDREWFQKDQDQRSSKSSHSSSASSSSNSCASTGATSSYRSAPKQKKKPDCPWKAETQNEPLTFTGFSVFFLVLMAFISGAFFGHFFM